MASMQAKYQRTLDHILALPKTVHGTFTIDYKESSASLGLTVNTFHRHVKKLLSQSKLYIVYKGGSLLPNVCKDIIMDADRNNDGYWEIRRNPNNFLRTVYSIHCTSQYDRDTLILRDVLGWKPKSIQHFQWWSNAKSLEYIVNPHGLSLTIIELLRQFVKYMVKSRFAYDSEEYDEYMDSFEFIENAHGIFRETHRIQGLTGKL